MVQTEFRAIVVSSEISLNNIARHFGITKKFKWEESLLLQDNLLQGIVKQVANKKLYIFHFGCMVFLNFQHHEIMDVINYLKKIGIEIPASYPFKYVDEYKLEVDSNETPAINNDCMITDKDNEYQLEIIATIIAKSVALDKVEAEINKLMDEIEEVVNKLHQGKLLVTDENLAKMAASILGFKLNTISYLMLLDKPDITWINEEAGALFNELSTLFELDDRYEKMRHKVEVLMDITEVFANLSHSKRGNRLEWAVIVLIAIEIGLSLIDLFVLKK